MQFSEKLWKIEEIIDTLSLLKPKQEQLFGVRTKLNKTKKFSDNLLATKMKITQIIMNKPVYLVLSILVTNKILMCEN